MYITERWLAGFIEGDGCFSHNSQQSGKYLYPKIEVHQKNREPLLAIKEKFGWSYYDGKRLGAVYIQGKRAQSFMNSVGYLMSSKRSAQALSRGFVIPTKTQDHDLEWFAGYYEAEGCIYIKTNGQKRIDGTKKLFCAMTISQYYSDETSKFCKNAFGTGRVAGPYMAKGELRAYSFNLSGQQAIKTVESIKHMLSQEKRRQLEEVIRKIDCIL